MTDQTQTQSRTGFSPIFLADAIFAGVSGAAFFAAPAFVAGLLGDGVPATLIQVIGVGLLAWSVLQAHLHTTRAASGTLARVSIMGDVVWVIASGIVLAAAWSAFSTFGVIAVLACAGLVTEIGWLKYRATV